MRQVDINTLQQLVDQGYLTCRSHPTADLLIWNYTPKTQYDRYWTEETMMCRGLITKPNGAIVARSFPKFFNLEEHEGPIPVEPFTITEKMDGSLGIMYFIDGKPYIATRGSFTSEQAIKANEILQKKYSSFRFYPNLTYLFEIIFRQNRIVVDYGDMEDLVLITAIHIETGNELAVHLFNWPFPVVRYYNGIKDINELKKLEEPNKEGFVIRFKSGLRLKAKFSEYVRLHKIITQCTARTIWDLLRNSQSFDDLLQKVPDEFYAWVQTTKNNLQVQYNNIEATARLGYIQVKSLPTRKEQAAIVCKHPHSAIIFSMLDGKDYADAIWKQLKPQAEKPFKNEEEACPVSFSCLQSLQASVAHVAIKLM